MADDTVLIPVHGSRRERLAATRRRRHRRIGVLVAAVAVTAVGGAAFAIVHADNGSASGKASHTAVGRALAGNANGNQAIKKLQQQGPPRIVSHDQPLKLWVGGDSLGGEIGPALGRIAGATGVVHTQVDYKVSSGLASNDIRDWYARGLMQMAQYNPEVVVFEIGTNDASIVNDTKNAAGQPAWEDEYRQKVDRMMDTFIGDPAHPRTVFWLGAPPMRSDSLDHGVRELNRVMREEAAKRAPHLLYVDTYNLLKGPNGGFTDDLLTLTGEVQRVRISDGVHLSDAGANYVAAVVYSLIDTQWDLRKHSDVFHPINWDESLGSSGNSGSSTGSNGSGSSSHQRRNSSGSGTGGSGSGTVDTPAPPPSLDTTAPSTPSASSDPPKSSPSSSPATSPSTSPHTPVSTAPSSTPPST